MRILNHEMKMITCSCCGGPMPELRLTKYGYSHCIKCSTVERVGCVPVVNHKTGNAIEIVDKDTAIRASNFLARPGYGVSRGIKGTSKTR